MVVDVKLEQENSCCKELKEKYSKLEDEYLKLKKRATKLKEKFHEAVRIAKLLTEQLDKAKADNRNLEEALVEERARVDAVRAGKDKELDIRISLENEISNLKSEISMLSQKGGSGAHEGDEEVTLLRRHISEGKREIKRLEQLLEKEKIKSDLERKNAEAEKRKAADVLKTLGEEKSRSDERKRLADSECKKAEEYRLQLESEQQNRRLEVQKHKLAREKRCTDLEKAKAEELKRLAEENNKKIMEEKSYANSLSRQLKESIQKIDELQNRVHELVSSKKTEANTVPPDKRMIDEIAKLNDKLESDIMKRESGQTKLVSKFLKFEEVTKRLEAEKRKASKEKKRADDLSRQLEEDRQTIEELRKEKHELVSSRNLVEAPAAPPSKCKNFDLNIEKMKLLKKQLKFEKMRVKHAKDVAELEKGRNNVLKQELGSLKQDFFQFSHRLDFLDKCFSCGIEGADKRAKTGGLSKMHKLNLKRGQLAVKPFQMYLRGENELLRPSGRAMDDSHHFGETLELSADPLLPGSRLNITEFRSGIDGKSGCPSGGSDRRMLQSSAISSSMTSFSDGPLVGSEEKGAFSVTTSAEFAENLRLEKSISRLSGEVTKTRNNENLVSVTENSVRSPLAPGKKRKRIVNAVESIGNLFSEGKKLHTQIEDELSYLHNMLNKQLYNSLEEARCLVPNPQGDSYANFNGFCKRRKTSHNQKQVLKDSVDDNEKKKTEKLDMNGSGDANFIGQATATASNLTGSTQSCRDGVIYSGKFYSEKLDMNGSGDANFIGQATATASNLTGSTQSCRDGVIYSGTHDQETLVSLGKLCDGDYMKLLDLDNAIDEEFYKMAREEPLSPTLPIIEFESGEKFQVDGSKHSIEETPYEGFTDEKDNMVLSCIDVEITSNLKINGSTTSHDSLLHKNGGRVDPSKDQGSNGNGFCNNIYEGKSPHENIPECCIVFSDIKDRDSISRIYRSTRNCIVRCDLFSHSSWAVQSILHAIVIEDLLPREKVCVLFSLLLYNFSGIASRNFFTSASNLCLDSFAGHVLSVVSGVETRSLFLESFCLDELLSLIEDFLIDGIIMVCTDPSTEASSDSRIKISLDSIDIVLSYKTASHDQLVAGSIILASLCVAVDEIGFICEASYNIFRTFRFGSSLMLTILHIFAYFGGKTYFTQSSYSLILVVIKSLVTYLETVDVSVGTASLHFVSEDRLEFSPCSKCPFSQDVIRIDDLTPLLLEKLENYALSGNKRRDLKKSVNLLNSLVLPDKEKPEQSCHERACCFLDTNFDESCCLDKLGMFATQSDSVISRFLFPCMDVLSLVELVAFKMSWAWSCRRVVPQLLTILESCELDNFSAAIIILLGQLGRLGVEANGYEDAEVENMRSILTAFLCPNNSSKLDFPTQIATVSALLQFLPMNFKNLIESSVELAVITSQSRTSDVIRKWFSLLSNEQKTSSFSLLQSGDVNNNQDIPHQCKTFSHCKCNAP